MKWDHSYLASGVCSNAVPLSSLSSTGNKDYHYGFDYVHRPFVFVLLYKNNFYLIKKLNYKFITGDGKIHKESVIIQVRQVVFP